MRSSIRNITIVLLVMSILLLQGCSIFSRKKDDDFSKTLISSVNADILEYTTPGPKSKDEDDVNDYAFKMLKTDNTACDEIITLYDTANELLKSEDHDNQKIRISIMSDHFQSGVRNYVAYFQNYDDNKICDHICQIRVNGIDRMTDDYDPFYRYELNNTSYWSYFSDTEALNLSGYVEAQTEIDSAIEDKKALEKLLKSDIDCIDFEPDDLEVWEPQGDVTWRITILSDKISSGSKYESVFELVEDIRSRLNEDQNEKDERFLKLNLSVEFSMDNDETSKSQWSFKNFGRSIAEPLDGFFHVDYDGATIEELASCSNVTYMNLYKEDIDDIRAIVDGVDGLEYVYVYSPETVKKLNEEYKDITFY